MRILGLWVVLLLSSPVLLSSTTPNASGPSLTSTSLGTVPRGVAVDSSSGEIYVVLYLNGTTLALDGNTLETVAKVATPSPYAIAANSATNRVYVSQGEGESVTVIDGSTNSVVATVMGAGTPYALAVDEAQNLVFGADTAGNSLWVIDGSTSKVVARVPMGDSSALALDPITDQAFVANLSSDFQTGVVDVVNITSRSVVRTVKVPFPPARFALDASAHMLFVGSGGGGGPSTNFIAMDDRTFQTVYALHFGDSPGVMVTASPNVYVSDPGADRLYELDEATGQMLLNSTGDPVKGISFAGITGMAFSPQNGKLYITENDVTKLVVLDAGASAPPTNAYLYAGALVVAVIAISVGVLLWRRFIQRPGKTAKR